MTIDINAQRWRFLHPSKSHRYCDEYEKRREGGWTSLVRETTNRQFATATEILNRLKDGQRGVLLADDVGLGKTTVAVLCALVFAGSGKRVRILAPNEMMSRRWRQELETHIATVPHVAGHLDLTRTSRRLGLDVVRMHPGTIAVSTHQKARKLNCDLLIIDEAHRARSEKSALARLVRAQQKGIGKILVLTATPFSIDPKDLARLLNRIGGKGAEKPMKRYATMLEDLWLGRSSGVTEDLASQLVEAASEAVEAIRPFVIRHGIDDLSKRERGAFGFLEHGSSGQALVVPDPVLEAMLRTDRALALGLSCKAWNRKRRNDPRYHVASGKLESDLTDLLRAASRLPGDEPKLIQHHGRIARRRIRAAGSHPKIAHTVDSARTIVEQGEKVLIFCDHHIPAVELTIALARDLRWSHTATSGPGRDTWTSAWWTVFLKERQESEQDTTGEQSLVRLRNLIHWLISDGIRLQIASWLGTALRSDTDVAKLVKLLRDTKARSHLSCDSIADHALQLYSQMTDRESRSTRAILESSDVTRLPGTTKARVAAVCRPDSSNELDRNTGVFFVQQPDATLAVFNSPFGPDVLVATDRLSEGVDLHRFCRHIIHHELDPSPVRTVQRNGRLRRVNSWAARTGMPIRVFYPSLAGTRDERLVEIMKYRLLQFDLLLGGVRTEVNPDDATTDPGAAAQILDRARKQLGRFRLGLK